MADMQQNDLAAFKKHHSEKRESYVNTSKCKTLCHDGKHHFDR